MNMNGPVYLSSASKKDNRVLNIDIPPKRLMPIIQDRHPHMEPKIKSSSKIEI